MDARSKPLALLLIALATAHCAGVVSPGQAPDDAAVPSDGGPPPVTPPPVTPPPVTPPSTASCAEVRAACGPRPATFVRGHATGLDGLDGARAVFLMRYVLNEGMGLNVPHGVVAAEARVAGGAFEACVCVPENANLYPEVAAVVFAPGSAGETSRDVARAMFSQRYATLGDEDVSYGLREAPGPSQTAAALAAMSDRTATVTLQGLDATLEGARLFAGLVADERPVASQISGVVIAGGRAQLGWVMPGRAWPSERMAVVLDRNLNHQCDDGDLGTTVRLDGRAEITGLGGSGEGAWLEGAALAPVCAALRMGEARE